MATETRIAAGSGPKPIAAVAAAPVTIGMPLPRLLPAVLSGGLLWLCFFPVHWGWLAWVALVPLLSLVRSRGGKGLYLAAWVGGLVFFVPALQWMRVADQRMAYAWLALSAYCALFVPLAIGLTRWLDARTSLPLVLTAPAAWVFAEFLRSFLLTGFPWYYLGHSQHAFLALIQM